jgi:hypothetical protein
VSAAQLSAAQLSAAQLSAAQLSAASSERHLNSVPLQLSADVNLAPKNSAPKIQSSTQRCINSAPFFFSRPDNTFFFLSTRT